jgi:hypothetical protein
MKKAYLLIIVIAVVLILFAFLRLFSTQANYQQALDSESGVFVLENPDNANIKIVTAKTDKITVDLNGSKDEIDKIRFYKKDGVTTFTFSDRWQELSGTITVPEGTLLDIKLSKSSNVALNDSKGKSNIKKATSFLVDTNSMNSLGIDGSTNDISIDGWGDVILWDTEKWTFLTGNDGQSGGEGEDEGENQDGKEGQEQGAGCSIGSQSIRNYCCEREQKNAEKPFCNGYGHWVFNNAEKQCEFDCEPKVTKVTDCSIGSQQERNSCCGTANSASQRPSCVGEWRYNNSTRSCGFSCFTEEEIKEHFGGGGSTNGGGTVNNGGQTDNNGEELRFCEDFSTKQEKDECCDYNLKTPLSIGPRPGFPDCIGKWYFDELSGCQFRCAEYDEMLEILKQLREKAQAEQEG